jgi:hypothetical protein
VSGDDIPDIHSYIDQINKLREENKQLTEDKDALNAGAVFTPSEERDFDHIRQKLNRDIELTIVISEQNKDNKSKSKVRKEIYKVNLLSVLSLYVNEGYNVFNRGSLAIIVFDEINKRLSQTDSDALKRVPDNNTIKENLSLELQTYGLAQFTEVRNYSPSDITCSLIEKMYRFRYWLDYYDYIPDFHFELISTVEEVKESRQATPSCESTRITLSLAKEIDRELKYVEFYQAWRTTEAGVLSARRGFEALCEELARNVEESNASSVKFNVGFRRQGEDICVLFSLDHSLIIQWSCPHPDTLDDSALLVNSHKTVIVEGGPESNVATGGVAQEEYRIEMNRELEVRWRSKEGKPFYNTADLASSLLITLLTGLRDQIVYNKA